MLIFISSDNFQKIITLSDYPHSIITLFVNGQKETESVLGTIINHFKHINGLNIIPSYSRKLSSLIYWEKGIHELFDFNLDDNNKFEIGDTIEFKENQYVIYKIMPTYIIVFDYNETHCFKKTLQYNNNNIKIIEKNTFRGQNLRKRNIKFIIACFKDCNVDNAIIEKYELNYAIIKRIKTLTTENLEYGFIRPISYYKKLLPTLIINNNISENYKLSCLTKDKIDKWYSEYSFNLIKELKLILKENK